MNTSLIHKYGEVEIDIISNLNWTIWINELETKRQKEKKVECVVLRTIINLCTWINESHYSDVLLTVRCTSAIKSRMLRNFYSRIVNSSIVEMLKQLVMPQFIVTDTKCIRMTRFHHILCFFIYLIARNYMLIFCLNLKWSIPKFLRMCSIPQKEDHILLICIFFLPLNCYSTWIA